MAIKYLLVHCNIHMDAADNEKMQAELKGNKFDIDYSLIGDKPYNIVEVEKSIFDNHISGKDKMKEKK